MARSRAHLTAIALMILTCATTTVWAADAPRANDLTQAFRDAGAVSIEKLQVVEIGGIVLIRGRADEKAQAEEIGLLARRLGHERVANLIQVIEAPDDALIVRNAERELTVHRSLDGCRFQVASSKGVLSVNGSVRHELQKDVAVQVLRNVEGVREVKLDLARF
jgi:osmotically-inducible protein OsmY